MKASNEEMQSTNEELRSTMEELETSKEELQSMNEELTTLNQENKHKVEELSQLSGDLQNLLAATDIATLFLDRQLRIMRFTPRVSELFNVRHLDRGRPLSDLTHRLGYDDLQHDAQQVLAKLVPIEREVRDEVGRWYLTRVLPYRSTDDRIEGVVITFVDITSRRESEEALRVSEEQFRALVETSAQIVWTAGADGNMAEDSPSWRAFPGQTYREWRGEGWLNAVHPADQSHAKAHWRQAVEASTVTETTFRLRYASGGWRWTVMRAVPLRNPDDSVRGWVGMNTDVTEQREAEEALRHSEEHLRLILESATDYVIFATDTDRKITDWNAGAEQLMGYTKAEILGQLADVLFIPEDREAEPEREMKLAKETGYAKNERWHVRQDGSRFWGSGAMMPLREKDDMLRGFLKIMINNTQRMQMEDALRQAKEEAEHLAHAKEEFLAHMSHEIRTPLNAIVGLADLLLRQNPAGQQLENLQTLKFSADNLKMLVNDILDFSKIQAGKVLVEEMDVHLKNLLHSLENAHRTRAAEQENELRFRVDEQIPHVIRTDSLKLSQIMNNLLSNAVKFTKNGTVTVDVSLQRREEDTLWVTFSVADTGIGIPPDKLATIFDTFTQADVSTVREYGGTGLGLSITKLLLNLMGSQIEVASEVGQGSRFFFTLPVSEGISEVSSSEEQISSPQERKHMSALRVLLVEDMAINRMVLQQFLASWWNLTSDEAANGQQAVEMAQQAQYDLILLDVRMPVMDGYQAAKAIRELPGGNYRQTPIIALTADTAQEIAKHPEAVLFTDVITKPFDPAALQQMITRYATRPPEQERTPSDADPSAEATAFSAAPLDLRKLEDTFYGNKADVQRFLEKAVDEVVALQADIVRAVAARDAGAMSDLTHKATVLLDLLGLGDLKNFMQQSRTALPEVSDDKLLEIRQEGEGRLGAVVAALRAELQDVES